MHRRMNQEKSSKETLSPGEMKEALERKVWSKPVVTEISRFSILSLAPTVSTAEGATVRAKSA